MSVERIEKIRSQVEFYFSDANFRVDRFLREQSVQHKGVVPIETVVSFKRLRDLEASVCDVKEALKDSKVARVEGEGIKKIETEEYLSYVMDKDISRRVMHISGFDERSSLEDIRDMLGPYMTPVLIRMRRDKSKKFSGSAFVELKCVEEVEKAISCEIPVRAPCDENSEAQAKKHQGEERYLVIKRKEEYLKEKERESVARKEREALEAIEKEFVPRLFRYECKEDLDIGSIRKMVGNTAFVDTQRKVIRMKHVEDFKEKRFEKDGKEIVVFKMSDSEGQEYCKNVKIAPKKKCGKK